MRARKAVQFRYQSMAQLEFDEETAKRLEALYTIRDSVRRRGLVRAAVAAAPGERILDVGCGPGFYCLELAEEVGPGGSIIGVDSSSTMLEAAADRCQGRNNVKFRLGDATSLPAEDAGFDAALCVQVLEYVSDVQAALGELVRVLRPGSRVVVWDIDWATVSWHSTDPARMARVLAAWDEHLAHPSLPRTLAPAMRSAGFEQVKMEAHSFATAELDPDAYGVATIPIVVSFVSGRSGVNADEAAAWAAEQQELGQRGEFFFACMQFCFSGVRSGESFTRGS